MAGIAGVVALYRHLTYEPPPQVFDGDVENSVGMKFNRIPAGKFMMGATEPEDGDASDDEGLRHEVTIRKHFYVGVTVVTQGQWKKVIGDNPSYFCARGGGKDKVVNTDDFPVEELSWEDAKEFLKKLNALPEEQRNGREYRLPSEAEWEYACRGSEQ